MRYKGTGNNIFSSNNFDPDFIEYLYHLPAEFLDEMFMAWVMMKNKKKLSKITDKEIKELKSVLDNIDLIKINTDEV